MKSQAMKSAEADGGFAAERSERQGSGHQLQIFDLVSWSGSSFIQNAGILDFIGQSPISSFAVQKISFHSHPLENRAKIGVLGAGFGSYYRNRNLISLNTLPFFREGLFLFAKIFYFPVDIAPGQYCIIGLKR